jgi:hypothetical protein
MVPLRGVGNRGGDSKPGNTCETISEKPPRVNTGGVSLSAFTYWIKFIFYA